MKCPSGKHQFVNRNDAVIFNKANGRKSKEYFSIYRCLWCNDFHLTSRGRKLKPIKIEKR